MKSHILALLIIVIAGVIAYLALNYFYGTSSLIGIFTGA